MQLFNAVQKHQRNVGEKVKEAGGSVRKRAKLMSTVSKKDFISVLRGMDGTSRNSPAGKSPKARQVGNPRHGRELLRRTVKTLRLRTAACVGRVP